MSLILHFFSSLPSEAGLTFEFFLRIVDPPSVIHTLPLEVESKSFEDIPRKSILAQNLVPMTRKVLGGEAEANGGPEVLAQDEKSVLGYLGDP